VKITKQRLEEIIKEELDMSISELDQVGDQGGSGVESDTPQDVDAAIMFVKQKINQTNEIAPFLQKLAALIQTEMRGVQDQTKREALQGFISAVSSLQVSQGAVKVKSGN
jgi:hypothetical protein